MKKWVYCLLVSILCLCGCSQRAEERETVSSNNGTEETIYAGSIAAVKEETAFLTGEAGTGLIALSLDGLEITDEAGNEMKKEDLSGGMLVHVTYDGAIMETYPERLSKPTKLSVIKREKDILGLYRQVIWDIYETDQALNSGKYLALDFTKVSRLSDTQKQALMYLLSDDFQKESFMGTMESLKKDGYVDGENLVFQDGVLITLEDESEDEEEEFSFHVQKWKSGKGAILWNACKATWNGNAYSYEIGEMGVS